MPLPMVHFAIAMHLHEGKMPHPDFLLGSIAPDAIHMRADTDRLHKNRTHLLAKPHAETEDDAYFAAVEAWLADKRRDPATAAFAAGYAAHVIADRLWLHEVYYPFRDAYPPDADPDERRAAYYCTVDQIDILLYRRMPWRGELWSQLRRATAHDLDDLLSADEIAGWRQRVLAWYDLPENDPGILPRHITYDSVLDFIFSASDRIRSMEGLGSLIPE